MLLKRFLEEECSTQTAEMFLADLVEPDMKSEYREYNFNMFDIHVNFIENTVTVEDIFESDDVGEEKYSLKEFIKTLQSTKT